MHHFGIIEMREGWSKNSIYFKNSCFSAFQFQEKEKTNSGYKKNNRVSHGIFNLTFRMLQHTSSLFVFSFSQFILSKIDVGQGAKELKCIIFRGIKEMEGGWSKWFIYFVQNCSLDSPKLTIHAKTLALPEGNLRQLHRVSWKRWLRSASMWTPQCVN